MFTAVVVLMLGAGSGSIRSVSLPDGRVSTICAQAGAFPDGVVVREGIVYWTTMGMPSEDPARSGEQSLDFSRRNGGLHAVGLDGAGAREVLPAGAVTTGKQLASDGVGCLYWGDREGCRVSRARADGTETADLVVNARDDTGTQECVGIAVDPGGYLYWTQKGPAKGGRGRIFRAGLEIPAGQTAADRGDIEVLWDQLPEPIDLEIHGDWLYWTDRGAAPEGNTLNRAPVPAPGQKGSAPEILAGGFQEAIGLAVDEAAGVVYVSDLGGRIHAVPLRGGDARVVAELHEPISGIAAITA